MQLVGVYTQNAPITLDIRTLHGIAQRGSQEAEWLLFDFLTVIRFIAQKQVESNDDKPRISSADLKAKFPKFSDLDLRRLHETIMGAYYFLGGGTTGDNFDQQISSEAHMFRTVATIPEFLAQWDRVRGMVAVPTQAPRPKIGFIGPKQK
jgi:hypothetical protein